MIKHAMPLLFAVSLAGCETSLPAPEYSRDYVMVSDEQGRQMLVPEACLGTSIAEEELEETMKLAPGCANSFNLLQMVERREDLVQGRATGPTFAAPVGRAAQQYLQGVESEQQRRRREEQAAQGDTGGAQ